MSSCRTGLMLSCVLLFTCAATLGHAQSAAQWQASQLKAAQQSEAIMQDADQHKGLLAQFQVMRYAYNSNKDPAFHLIFGQYLSWYQTFIGDYPDASASFSIKQELLPGDSPSPLSSTDYTARPALDVIPELAKNYRAVFFNEAHNVPLTRILTVQLLSKLRAEGFNYFAAETLYQSDTKLQSRGYPIKDSGFYTEEPICAEMVRTALKLGFKVIAYEALSEATGDAREAEQAHNIYEQVFRKDPSARLVLDAGYAHIQKSGKFLNGYSMAEHLHKLAGIDPLSVEQTMLFPHQSSDDDHPYYTAVMQQLQPKTPIVFVDKAGKPWTLRTGYDVSVFFPPQEMRRGRPTWLSLGGLRYPFYIDGERCARSYPCLVQARYADEDGDGIPADRLVLDPIPLNTVLHEHINNGHFAPSSELYLRPGQYKLTFTSQDASMLYQQNITVTGQEDQASRVSPDPPRQQSTRSSTHSCAQAEQLPSQLQRNPGACSY